MGQDVLFVMDQSEQAPDGTIAGLNHKFSAGWTIDGDGKVTVGGVEKGTVTVTWNDNFHTTVLIDDGIVGQLGGDLTINLVGVQGADANTTVAELFGLTQATA